MGRSASASEVERTVSAVAELALHHGARAGLDALAEAAVFLTGVSGAALYAAGRRVALSGLAPPTPARAHPLQMQKDGHTALVLGEPCVDASDRQLLTRLAVLGSALLACQEREDAARAERTRLRWERLRLVELLAHWDRARSRQAHDLRTPLQVIQGYIDMLNRGMAGALTPPMQRYLERIGRAASELNVRLQHRPSRENVPAEDFRVLLSASFGPGRPGDVRLELPAMPVRIRASRSRLELMVRTLERMLRGVRASEIVLRVEAPESTEAWQLTLQARAERPLPEKARASLERIARAMEARISVREDPELEVSLVLPRILG
ncbi:histidine kinase dimerization/phospho-acceptor domain-containing protein [Archangium lipolyticum]|uniref:histidine kinase dimerization/phospho-acceptor domain-containing protein n=1 Tax=Archangium lipolyticum TaxID=2970465 RepID=UPI002149DCE5|nr:histidine kinase dimerization/phospho-acceptor domain-containing protein [Archangium lipolyticum]